MAAKTPIDNAFSILEDLRKIAKKNCHHQFLNRGSGNAEVCQICGEKRPGMLWTSTTSNATGVKRYPKKAEISGEVVFDEEFMVVLDTGVGKYTRGMVVNKSAFPECGRLIEMGAIRFLLADEYNIVVNAIATGSAMYVDLNEIAKTCMHPSTMRKNRPMGGIRCARCGMNSN